MSPLPWWQLPLVVGIAILFIAAVMAVCGAFRGDDE